MNPFGAVLPNQQHNPLDLYLQMQQQQQQQERYQQQLALQQQRYSDGLLADLADRLDMKHFATGTAFDPVFQQSANTALKGIAETIKGGGDYSDALMQAMNAANEIATYSGRVRNIRKGIEEGAKLFEKDPSIDAGKLSKLALTKALMKPGENGVGLRDTSELDDTKDYISEVLDTTPEYVSKGLGALYDQLEKGKYIDYESEVERDLGGVKRLLKYKGKYDPTYNELLDEKGNVIDANTGKAVGLRVKGEQTPFGMGVTDDVLNHFYQNRSTKVALQGAARQFIRGAGLPAEAQKDVEKALLHRELSGSANAFINKVKDETDNSQQQAQQFRLAMKEFGKALSSNNKGSEETAINDAFARIRKGIEDAKSQGAAYLNPSMLGTNDQAVLNEIVQKTLNPRNDQGFPSSISPSDYIIVPNADGTTAIHLTPSGQSRLKLPSGYVGTVNELGVNLKAQPSVKEKRSVLQKVGDKVKSIVSPKKEEKRPSLDAFIKK